MKKLSTLFISLLVALVFSGTIFAAGAEEKTQEGAMGTPQKFPAEQDPMMARPLLSPKGDPMALPRADAIIGLQVLNEQGQELGKVEDLTLSEDGRINYIIISQGGLLGIGSKHFAIPWDVANASIHENALVIGLSKERFASAPSFENWSDFAGGKYEQDVRAYYGKESGSEKANPSETEPGMKSGLPGSGSETGNENQQQ